MKTARCMCSKSHHALLSAAIFGLTAILPPAFGNESPIAILSQAPLSLPRLAPEAAKLGQKPVRGEAFGVLSLTPGEHAKQKFRGETGYLEIEPGAEWQQKLRTQRTGANYVTFTLNASIGTRIDIDGASLVIEQSERDVTYAAVQVNGTDKSIHHETPWMLFGGARMAALDIVTVKVDRKDGTWAMWFRDTLVAENKPLAVRQDGAAQIRVTAGKAGAWLCGLVCSDENPLFEDANDNAVPDEFEQKIIGALLSQNASGQTRANLRLAWDEKKRTSPPAEFVLTTPLPDSFPADCAPEGQVVHGMTDGLKFGAPRKN